MDMTEPILMKPPSILRSDFNFLDRHHHHTIVGLLSPAIGADYLLVIFVCVLYNRQTLCISDTTTEVVPGKLRKSSKVKLRFKSFSKVFTPDCLTVWMRVTLYFPLFHFLVN